MNAPKHISIEVSATVKQPGFDLFFSLYLSKLCIGRIILFGSRQYLFLLSSCSYVLDVASHGSYVLFSGLFVLYKLLPPSFNLLVFSPSPQPQ